MPGEVPKRYGRNAPRHFRPYFLKAPEGAPKGQKIERLRYQPETDPGRIQIRFMPDGRVVVPRYEEAEKAGELRVKYFVTLGNSSAAVRQPFHALKSIATEMTRMGEITRQLSGVHYEIEINWKNFNAVQKKSAIDYLNALAGSLRGKREITNKDKNAAIEKIEKAVELLGKGNDSAALLSIFAAANRVNARIRVLARQRPLMSRRERMAIHAKRQREFLNVTMIGRTRWLIHQFQSFDKLPQISRDQLLAEMDILKKFASESFSEKTSKQLSKLVEDAVYHYEEGGVSSARANVERFFKNFLVLHSGEYILSPELLETVKSSSDPKVKLLAIQGQARVMHDNVEYWWKRATPEQKNRMKKHLSTLANILIPLKEEGLVNRLVSATRALNANNPAEAKRMLEAA